MAEELREDALALYGGTPVRDTGMPPRLAFGDDEVRCLSDAIEYYTKREQDPPYQGIFEEEFCSVFARFMGGGFADAVSTGTSAVYVALAALDLPKGSEVIMSPVTDSGPLNSIILQGYVPVIADSIPKSYNIGVEQFLERVTPRTTAVLAVHCGGEPLDGDSLVAEAHKKGVKVLEDCSQATGALWKGRRVGVFGDIAAFSTMYRKNLIAGASSGIVYTQNTPMYRRALAHADRGKQVWRNDVNQNDPGNALFPALNFNTDELSCAIGLASLRRLQDTIDKRVAFIKRLIALMSESKVCSPYHFHDGFSPFFFPVFVDTDMIRCSKTTFAEAVAAEGIGLNPHYGCVISSWEWAKPYLSDGFIAENALNTQNRSFNLSINERYGEKEAQDIVSAILKVESYFLKR